MSGIGSFVEVWQTSVLTPLDLGPAAQLVTGSPTSIAQTISTPSEAFILSFNVLFEDAGGNFNILFDGVPISLPVNSTRIDAGVQDVRVLVRLPLALGRSDLELTVFVDGATGSSVVVDNLEINVASTGAPFDGIQNGDFGSGDLSGWTVASTGSGGANVVPEPTTALILALGLAALAGCRRL